MTKRQIATILRGILIMGVGFFWGKTEGRAADLCVNMCQNQQGPAQQSCLNLCKSSQGHESQTSLTEAWNSPKAEVTEYGSHSLSINEQNIVKSGSPQGSALTVGALSVNVKAPSQAPSQTTGSFIGVEKEAKEQPPQKRSHESKKVVHESSASLSQALDREKGDKYLLGVLAKQTKEENDAKKAKKQGKKVHEGKGDENLRAHKNISEYFETQDDREPRCNVGEVFTLLFSGLWREAISQANECYNPLL